jgi:hypothetical protein
VSDLAQEDSRDSMRESARTRTSYQGATHQPGCVNVTDTLWRGCFLLGIEIKRDTVTEVSSSSFSGPGFVLIRHWHEHREE